MLAVVVVVVAVVITDSANNNNAAGYCCYSHDSRLVPLGVGKSNRRPLSHDPPVECNSEVRFMKSLKTDSELKKDSIRAGTISVPKTNA